MKTIRHTFYKLLLIINLIYVILAGIIYRRRDISLPFIRLELGAIVIALIITAAISIYRSEKGHTLINIILAYILVLPSLYVFRNNFGRLLFRSAAVLYIIFITIGIIYGVALYIASRKYKQEVDDLNAMLSKHDQEKEKNT